MWNRGRARSAKVHACGAQLKGEFQEISRECEGARSPKVHACGAQNFRQISDLFSQILPAFFAEKSAFLLF